MPMPIATLSSDNHTGQSSVGVLCPRDGGVRIYRDRCAGADAPLELATFDGEAVVCALHQFLRSRARARGARARPTRR